MVARLTRSMITGDRKEREKERERERERFTWAITCERGGIGMWALKLSMFWFLRMYVTCTRKER